MYLNEVKNYDEVRRAFFKMGRYKPLPPQSAKRQTISKVARFTNEPEDVATLYYIPHFLESRMMHYWAIHSLLTLNELPEFFDTLDYVNDDACHLDDLIKLDFFATLPQFMNVKAAVRFALYNTPVVHRPSRTVIPEEETFKLVCVEQADDIHVMRMVSTRILDFAKSSVDVWENRLKAFQIARFNRLVESTRAEPETLIFTATPANLKVGGQWG